MKSEHTNHTTVDIKIAIVTEAAVVPVFISKHCQQQCGVVVHALDS